MSTPAEPTKVIPILENTADAVPGKICRLHETFVQNFNVVSDPFVVVESADGELVEKREGDGPMVISGIFQYEGRINANKRVYGRGLWEKHLKEGSDLNRRIRERRAHGQLEHPEKGVGKIGESAILVTKVWLGEPEADGARAVMGEAEVLSTPQGRIVRDLIRDRVCFGISSRATGSVDGRGMVEEKTFRPETWDIVGNPSTPGAFPNVVDSKGGSDAAVKIKTFRKDGMLEWHILGTDGLVESVSIPSRSNKNTGVVTMSESRDLNTVSRLVESICEIPINESNAADLDRRLADASVEVGELSTQPAFKSAANVLTRRIEERRAEIDSTRKNKTTQTDEGEGEQPRDWDKCIKLLKDAHRALGENAAEIARLTTTLAEHDARLTELTDALAESELRVTELAEHLTGMTGVMQELTVSEDTLDAVAAVSEAIDEAKAVPGTEKIHSLLERCETVEEVNALMEHATTTAAPARPSRFGKDLPALNESNSQTDQRQTARKPDANSPVVGGARIANAIISRTSRFNSRSTDGK